MTEIRTLDFLNAYPLDKSWLSHRTGWQYELSLRATMNRDELAKVATCLREIGFDVHPSMMREEPQNAEDERRWLAASGLEGGPDHG